MASSDNAVSRDAAEAASSQISFDNNRYLIDLCGEHDRNLSALELGLGVQIIRRGNALAIMGSAEQRAHTKDMLTSLYHRLEQGRSVGAPEIDAALRMGAAWNGNEREDVTSQLEMFSDGCVEIKTRKKVIEPRTNAQKKYVADLMSHPLCFGIGPAGTGKTYLAVAVAVSKFISGEVDRIILSRPAVEAGEKLGYLPGDMKDKVDPYMQPLYDALHDFLPGKDVARLIEEKRIEIAPLAFMRGRTLSNAYVVLDEAQNATSMQMKMFLTRLGEGAKMAITGDRTQVDLPRGMSSGLRDAEKILKDISDISFCYFSASDVVRHPLVAKILIAYDRAEPGGT